MIGGIGCQLDAGPRPPDTPPQDTQQEHTPPETPPEHRSHHQQRGQALKARTPCTTIQDQRENGTQQSGEIAYNIGMIAANEKKCKKVKKNLEI